MKRSLLLACAVATFVWAPVSPAVVVQVITPITAFTLSFVDVTIGSEAASVPEPSSLLLLLTAGVVLVLLARRRRR